MLVNASDREGRGQLSYLRRAGFLKVESDMSRRPGKSKRLLRLSQLQDEVLTRS